ncbi:hypothetical protein NECAME_06050 [Necator americanus]|uniref:Uncharacterized protein n=1 Tax=Necator americanus TaxID=51031 RepID=W2TWW2_NECAM|nr:hypothetical protein NECAME_06050 [Necator americanus]ETN86169.1 hypothetical protein NECAME_06050 [Necator americanus]
MKEEFGVLNLNRLELPNLVHFLINAIEEIMALVRVCAFSALAVDLTFYELQLTHSVKEVDNSCTKKQNEKSERLKEVKTIEEDLRTAKETEKPTQIVSVRESTKESASSANESVSKETVIREKHVFEKIVREVEDSGPPKEVLSTAKEAEKSQISSEHLKEVKNIEEDVHTAKEIEKPTQTVSVSESGKESLNTARQSVSKETRIVEKHVFEKTVKVSSKALGYKFGERLSSRGIDV